MVDKRLAKTTRACDKNEKTRAESCEAKRIGGEMDGEPCEMKERGEGLGVYDYLYRNSLKGHVSFHMPGHKGASLYEEFGYGDFFDRVMDCDITEIPGADNLFQPEGIIAETMERYRRHYGARKSYLLVNGSSAGILAAILAVVRGCDVPTVCPDSAAETRGRTAVGGKLVMARNCHKSVFNALRLGGLSPVYARPDMVEDYGISGAVSVAEVARCLDENPDAEAVILPSPNYYGICSDIEAIADEVHSRGKVLIVDQAHGAHLKMLYERSQRRGRDENSGGSVRLGDGGLCAPIPKPAELQGADIVINSIHKTLASWTQTAVLNVCSEAVELADLEDLLQSVESSSPSYPLMASLDISAELLAVHGDVLADRWLGSLAWFYESAKKLKRIHIMDAHDLDYTKINVDVSGLGISGLEAEAMMMEAGVIPELVTGNVVMCMSGIGNRRCDFEALLAVLEDMDTRCEKKAAEGQTDEGATSRRVPVRSLAYAGIPRKKELVSLTEAAGRVCAKSIIPYPPGIPIACPGEILDEDVLTYVGSLRKRGEKVIGVHEGGLIEVGADA